MPKSQISPLTDFVKLLTTNILQLSRNSEKSVKICQNLSKSVHCADLRRNTYPFHFLRSLFPWRSLREALFPLRILRGQFTLLASRKNRKNEKKSTAPISYKEHRFCEKIASRFRDNMLSINYLQKSKKFIFSHFFALFRKSRAQQSRHPVSDCFSTSSRWRRRTQKSLSGR